MILSFQRCLFTGVLTIWGILLTYFYVSGRINAYLHPSFHPWTLASGIFLLVVGTAMLFLPGGEHSLCDDDCQDTHAPRSKGGLVLMALVLVAPLLVATVVSPSQFSATTVMNRGYVSNIADLPGYQPQPSYTEPALPTQDGTPAASSQDASSSDFVPKTAEGNIKAETVDLLYAAEEPSMRADFEDKPVELIGQFMPAKGHNAGGNRFSLVKMYIVCCAADARPVAVSIETPQPTNLPEMGWVKVIGKATFPVEGGRRLPVVKAESVAPCDPPQDTLIYN